MRDRDALDRATARLRYCRSELSRFSSYSAEGGETHERTKRKLTADLERAETDLRHAQAAHERHLRLLGMA